MENKYKILKVLVIVLSLLVVGLTGYIVYDKVLNKDNNDAINGEINNDNNQIQNDSNNNENTSWSDYLLSMHILDAKIYRFRSKDLGDNEDIDKTVTIDFNELEDLISQLEKTSSLEKYYTTGVGGPIKDRLTILYEYNDKTYKFEILQGRIDVETLDYNFINVLDQSDCEEFGTDYKNQEGSFYFYELNGYSNSLFDNYFK